MARDDLGRLVAGTSGNAGGRPKPPDGLRTRLAELSPLAVERLAELLDSGDERVVWRRPGRSSTGISGRPQSRPTSAVQRGAADGHLAALIAIARRQRWSRSCWRMWK